MRLSLFLALSVGLLSKVVAAEAVADFPQAGFSITPLDPKPSGKPAQMVAAFALPAQGNFASNVNVILYSGHPSMKSFVATSRKELEAMKVKAFNEDLTIPNTWILEYTSTQAGHSLHHYQRAIWKDGRVYGATATTLETEWVAVSAQIKACVDSLKLK